jgi:hypothetical protein
LEREVKEILDDFSSDETLKSTLLKGKRVDLAEELSKKKFTSSITIISLIFRTCSTNSRKIRRIYSSIKYRKIIFSFIFSLLIIITHETYFFDICRKHFLYSFIKDYLKKLTVFVLFTVTYRKTNSRQKKTNKQKIHNLRFA